MRKQDIEAKLHIVVFSQKHLASEIVHCFPVRAANSGCAYESRMRSGITMTNDDLLAIINAFQYQNYSFHFTPLDTSVSHDFVVTYSDASFFPII